MSNFTNLEYLLKQGLAFSGGEIISNGGTATGSFCAIVCLGTSTDASGLIGGSLGSVSGNVSSLSSKFLGHGTVVAGSFTSVTAGGTATDIFLCVKFPE